MCDKTPIRIACVTNSIEETAHLMLEKTGQLPYIDYLVHNEIPRHPKPSAEGYIMAMIVLRAFPHECLIVEDSDKGYEAAKNTGAEVLRVDNASGVTWQKIATLI